MFCFIHETHLIHNNSDSQVRAEDHQQQLISSVDLLLKDNKALVQMLLSAGGAGAAFDARSQRRASIQTLHLQGTFAVDANNNNQSDTGPQNRYSFSELEFEKDLKASRVYRRVKRDTMDFSMRSSIAHSHAWSIFSGISLSDISEISVLALPIYPEDITNSQHYNFGPEIQQPKKPSLPSTVYTRSIFHECVEAELQLSQLQLFDFDKLIAQERQAATEEADPLAILIAVFRHGRPLLMLFEHLDNSLHDRWDRLLLLESSQPTRKLAVAEFVQGCVTYLDIKPADCFTVTDLMGADTTNHIKVNAPLVPK